ncbi:PAS domain-containing protein [Micromonospora sp. STR1s_5]|nr:PAS domain-containing protein [Micromonospora sp. STR1s_5]
MEDLYDDVRRVLRTLASVEREVTAPSAGTRYIVRILPYRSIDNYIAGAVLTFVDVTDITRAEERTRMLLSELQHRVRNTLGVVRSIARRTADQNTSVEEHVMHLDGRLRAFARTQALVTRDPEGGVDLEYLVADELNAYRAKETDQVRISGPPIRLQSKAAETLGLAIHELATNAVKYGALSSRKGCIEASWSIEPDGDASLLEFEWRERDGPQIQELPERRGFGTELLERTLAYELKGKTALSFERTGLRCSITLPLTPKTVVSSGQVPR